MAEVLTESFCERCGTRYTFESAKPRVKRLKGVKVLSRGLKNFVLSDDSSLDEAMAAARSDSEREVTSQQLDAFHKTFNFCMTCRQYTCANCWNEAEGTCLTCSPHLAHDILPAPFPDLDPRGMTVALGGAELASPNGTNGTNGSNGSGHRALIGDGSPWPTADAWPTADGWPSTDPTSADPGPAVDGGAFVAADEDEIDVEARLAALTAIGAGHIDTPEPDLPVEAMVVAEPDQATEAAVDAPIAVEIEAVAEVEAVAEPQAIAEVEAAAEVEPEGIAEVVVAAELIEASPDPGPEVVVEAKHVAGTEAVADPEVVAAPVPPTATPSRPLTTDEVAAVAAAQTTALLGRFRPGQNLDAEIEAYEREQDQGPVAAETEPEAVVAAETEPTVIEAAAEVAVPADRVDDRSEPVVAEAIEAVGPEAVGPEAVVPEPVTLEAEAVEPEPVVVEALEPEPELVALVEELPQAELVAATAEPEPVAAAVDHDAGLAAAAAAAALAAAAAPKATDVVAQPTWRIVAPDVETLVALSLIHI